MKTTYPIGKPVFVHLTGDGETYRQGIVGPVMATPSGHSVIPLDDCDVCLLVERMNGQLLLLSMRATFDPTLHVGKLCATIERCNIRLSGRDKDFSLAGEQIFKLTRRRLTLLDGVLDLVEDQTFSATAKKAADLILDRRFDVRVGKTTPQERRAATESVLSQIRQHLRDSAERFLGDLDQEILQTLRITGTEPSIVSYNSYMKCADPVRKVRLQASQSFPLLGSALAEPTGWGWVLAKTTVDTRRPLLTPIAETFKVPEEVVRWLRNKTVALVGTEWTKRLPELANLLACICPEHRPRNADDWRAFSTFAAHLSTDNPLHRNWLGNLGKTGWVTAIEKFAQLRVAPLQILDIEDLFNELNETLSEEIRRPSAQIRSAILESFLSVSVIRQLKTSICWHQLETQTNATDPNTDNESGGDLSSWPAPFDGILSLQGLEAICLNTRGQLATEGLAMKHCVGGYAENCLYSGSIIISFRGNGGHRISTAELRPAKDTSGHHRLAVVQHRARGNAEAPDEAKNSLRALLVALNDPSYQTRLGELASALEKRRQRHRDSKEALSHRTPAQINILKIAMKEHLGYEHFRSLVSEVEIDPA